MTPGTEPVPEVIFGLEPMLFAGGVFLLTYILIMTERINRAIVAMAAAAIMILGGVLTQEAAVRGVDFNTLGLLTGMMIIVSITRKSGIFQYVAIWSAKRVDARPWGILVVLVLVTAVLSALLDNVTTVLLIAPVTLLIADELKVSPYPYLFTEIFASNVGGAATLIGDPPNIMIGSAVGLGFNDFLFNLGPIVLLILPMLLIPFYLLWGRKLQTTPERRLKVMRYEESDAIKDKRLLWQSLGVLALVIAGFILGHDLGYQPATIAMFGASLLLLITNIPRKASEQSKEVDRTLADVEWITIFFFIGLFIVVYGVESTGLLELVAHYVIGLTGGDMAVTTITILWVSAVVSALVDNIPFVATMIPLIENMGGMLGDQESLTPLWWSLALGSCLGGNGSLIGASANLIVAGFAERAGHPIRFLPFMLIAFPLMLVTILISSIYVYLRYL
ncbi:MAG: ArsB/NhaD family transporter [Sedimenticolaceae bacterium]|nr:ArsB/NhaD family transporter [Sedimenticolaceae bacterium]